MPNTISFKTFLGACGTPKDQLAGFAAWVKQCNLDKRPATMATWRAKYQEFLKRPVTY